MPPGRPRDLVFVSYSHANPDWRDKILTLLKPFARQGHLKVWADPYIRTGDVWRRGINEALSRTRVGVVLLTQDLLASDFIAEVEVPHLLRAAQADELVLVVVPIEPHVKGSTRFADGDLEDFHWPWPAAEPIAEMDKRRRPRALATVVQAIMEATDNRTSPASVGLNREPRSAGSVLASSDRLGTLYGVPALPSHYLARAKELEQLKLAIQSDTAVVGVSAGVDRVGVHGQGGLGKSVLAASLAHDPEVRRTFPDGILWIPIGQQPQLEVLQAELAEQFGERTSVEDVSAGVRLLRARLARKACLVILDDVWQLLHAKAFDVLDVRSRLLVTTRDRSLVTALGAREVRLDVLSPPAAVDLMAQWAGSDARTLPPVARELAREVGYLPLGLSLAGAQVRDGRSWDDLLEALQEGRLDFLDHPYGSVFSSIRTSVDALASDEAARYMELAVFPEDVPVPVAVVETLWHATCGMDQRDARALLSRLASFNLLSLSQVVKLHDLQHDFIRLVANDVARLHGRLVDVWRATTNPKRAHSDNSGDAWAGLPMSPDYPWHYLTHHLYEAGRHEELEQVLTSVEWLSARLRRFNLPSVLADFRPVLRNAALREVRDALMLSSHVVSKEPRALIGQLRGRLLDTNQTAVRRLIDSPEPNEIRPFFRPVIRCLTAPGGPLLQTLEDHSGSLNAIAVLPDGQQALSGGADGTIRLWDLTSGAVLQTFEGHTRGVTAVSVLDGQRALSAGFDSTLKLWDLSTGTVLRTFIGHLFEVNAIAILPDGQRALSGGADRTLKLWDLTSGAVLQTLADNTHSFRLSEPGDRVKQVVVVPDGQRALSVGIDGGVRLWDLTSGAVRSFLQSTGVITVAVLPDGQRALSAGYGRTITLWDLTSGRVLQTFEDDTREVNTVTVLPDGQRALSSSADGVLKLWDLTSGAVLQSLEGHTRRVTAVAVLPNGQQALSASVDGTLRLWDLRSQNLQGRSRRVTALAMLPDGQRALSADSDRTLKLWDLTSGAVLQTLEGDAIGVYMITVLPDGQRALSASGDGAIKLWDLTSGAVLQTFEDYSLGVYAVAVLPDGRRALSGKIDGMLRMWDLTSGAFLRTFRGHSRGVNAVTILPNGQCALSGSADGTLKLWDLTSGAALQTFKGHTAKVNAVTALPDGQRALSGSADGTLKLWDLTSGAALQTFEGHTGEVNAVTALPDGQRALSGSADRTLRLWGLPSGAQLTTFHGDAPFTAAHGNLDNLVALDALGRLHIHAIK